MTDIMVGIALPRPDVLDALLDLIRGGLTSLATVFTNAGAAVLNNRVIQAGTAPKLIAWGTGSTAAATTDTDLQTEASETLSGARVTGTESRVTTSVTNDTYQVAGTVTAAGTKTIAEMGLLDAQSSGATVPNAHGNLFLRSVFTGIAVNSGDSIAFTAGLKQVPN